VQQHTQSWRVQMPAPLPEEQQALVRHVLLPDVWTQQLCRSRMLRRAGSVMAALTL